MVAPLRAALLDEALGVVDEILEAAVVEVRGGQGHGYSSRTRSRVRGELAGVLFGGIT